MDIVKWAKREVPEAWVWAKVYNVNLAKQLRRAQKDFETAHDNGADLHAIGEEARFALCQTAFVMHQNPVTDQENQEIIDLAISFFLYLHRAPLIVVHAFLPVVV